ncbi:MULTISPECIES: tRNA (adenosine(37)-N6)-threonylcarbamoyltransferase complex dimerization subunit type 1 TsaB [unclassified Brenneria]|uniref:tRNA (adenosine(37)-N6)-threonylcarbamoyltransferase complex dimerization subunit type 1 TsaB n=1 Tax=unclassified Brenneria TaxID=2634434 RepID=UPI0029C546B9|nr:MULTISPECIES: tRNA (adenosine(37)-N6)-threonylcarbamoyltransferase complex dimerization subunit type 1 TsaB [unclassified Brenneria]MDX5626764.1 tRNA (adenosine(37)-N6)-threonylcarbamoyltransferase complex dimerization subunit type 1 TsaB [Brenneria sp. L3-3Z]MDX5693886.1 tRNA (adenosine(37)-N6)-threonylcarbamoyltransferase complex dimerization subunit type 1 TsaB [Brenneria sp. L4-2C]MEE3661473.1 tRNA (adenosine(37)-N6)-threonylcarbamoyltransferase complex dimerization subunit type 1 TsaB [B
MSTRILALDTATEACSVALWNDGEIHSLFEVCPREHTQRVLPMVRQALAESGLTLNALDALAFGQGPGSFTGVRIGIGIAQGLALGADLPMIGVSTLATMAQGAFRRTGATQVLAAIDARMGEVYWAQYQREADGRWQGDASEAVLTPQQVQSLTEQLSGRWTTVGTGWKTYADLAKHPALSLQDGETPLPQAEDMLPLACRQWQAGRAISVELAQPRYLRNEVAWKKLPGRE